MTPRRVACSPCLGPALSVVQVLAPVVVLCDPPARLRSPRSRGAVGPVWRAPRVGREDPAGASVAREIRVCGSTVTRSHHASEN